MTVPAPAPRLRDHVEAALFHLLAIACRVVPERVAYRAVGALGALAAGVDRRWRNVALANLELAYGAELTTAERSALVTDVYRNFARIGVDYLLLLKRGELKPLTRFLELENVEPARAAVKEHGAVIIASLHLGHWDLLGGVIAEQVAPLAVVVQPLRNPLLEARMARLRAALGVGVILRDAAVPALFRHLRRGTSVALVCDLNQKEGPQFADFFGHPAATVRTPGVLAVRCRKPVVCCAAWSTGEPLRYGGRMNDPIVPRADADPDEEAGRIVCEMNRQLEAFVRDHPGQWNWIHRRWRTRPPR